MHEEEGIVKGREVLTMDDRTPIKWVLGPSHNAHRTRSKCVTTGINEPAENLRAKLLAATIELAAEGSHLRLIESRHVDIAL